MKHLKKYFVPYLLALSLIGIMFGCASTHQPLPTPKQVDLERFMGPWFVQGYTPILVDKQAHNAVEHYYLNDKGRVETTYQFRDGAFDGELKTYTPKGFPDSDDPSNARWQMQFVWPIKADYVIIHIDENYNETIVAHPNRKYAWIMTRDTEIADVRYNELLSKLEEVGYATDVIQRLPQDWSSKTERARLENIREVGASAPLAN